VKKLILLIEADSLLRSTCFELLERENFNIISAEDGLLGLTLAREFQPDLIICDINTPHLDGYGVFKDLRANLATAKIPCIFFTSETEPDSYYYAQQLGVNDYLTKPIQIEKLLEAIYRQFQKTQNREVDFV
jgi:DNA-binding response OmpR family regulator